MANARDPYQILGVSKTASAEEIKRAYRRLAKQYHPDLNPGRTDIEQRFKEISAAYALLSDSDKRARYDHGEIDANGTERAAGRAGGSGGGGNGGFSGFNAEDIFADLFGSRRRNAGPGSGPGAGGFGSFGNKPQKGSDINYAVTIPFLEAALGTKRRISLSNGKSIEIAIPPGTEDQQKLRLKGQGMNGANGGPDGDAIIEVHVETHPLFIRMGDDIHIELPVTLPEAVLGATIKIPTIDGTVALKVPAGSNTGSTLRLKNKGLTNQKTRTRGDQYIKLKVLLPDPPDTDLIQFMEKWSRERGYDVRKTLFPQ